MSRRFRQAVVGVAAATLVSTLLLVPTAAATSPVSPMSTATTAGPPRDGFGFAFADDGQIVRDRAVAGLGDPLYGLGDAFARLRPKAFRFTVPYNAVEVPAEIDRAKAIINRVKEVGVEEILVTFRQKHNEFEAGFTWPEPASWRGSVKAFMDLPNGTKPDGGPKTINDDVTMWSPADQPNAGTGWLTGSQYGLRPIVGHERLAAYYNELKAELSSRQSPDKLVSPEFHDELDNTGRLIVMNGQSTVWNYIRAYYNAGGRFGDFLGWHPYDGVKFKTLVSTTDFLAATNYGVSASEQNTPVILTAIGWQYGHPPASNSDPMSDILQHEGVRWLVTDLAKSSDRIKRVHYYQGRQPQSRAEWDRDGGQDVKWEAGLVRKDGSVRPGWYTWCAASHGDDANHPDCLVEREKGRWYLAASLGDRFGAQSLWRSGHGTGSTEQFLANVDAKTDDAVAYFESTGCWQVALSGPAFLRGVGLSAEAMCGFGTGSTSRHVRRSRGYSSLGAFFDGADAQGRAGRWYFNGNFLWLYDHGQGSTDQFLADVTGDGTDEMVAYYKSTGCWRVAIDSPRHVSQWLCQPEPGGVSSRPLMDDVTGDGKADAVLFVDGSPAGRWYVAPSTGTKFEAFTQWTDGHGAGSQNQFLGDVNGDRKNDAVVFSNGCWYAALSLGNGFAGATAWRCGHGQSSSTRLLGDVTGDGKADAVTFYNDETEGPDVHASGELSDRDGDYAGTGELSIVVGAEDEEDGVAQLQALRADGTPLGTAGLDCSGGCPLEAERTFSINTTALPEGPNMIRVAATDSVGARTVEDGSEVIVDHTPPAQPTKVVVSDYDEQAGTATVSWTAGNDPVLAEDGLPGAGRAGSLLRHRRGEAWSEWELVGVSETVISGLAPGEAFGIEVRARDQVGNASVIAARELTAQQPAPSEEETREAEALDPDRDVIRDEPESASGADPQASSAAAQPFTFCQPLLDDVYTVNTPPLYRAFIPVKSRVNVRYKVYCHAIDARFDRVEIRRSRMAYQTGEGTWPNPPSPDDFTKIPPVPSNDPPISFKAPHKQTVKYFNGPSITCTPELGGWNHYLAYGKIVYIDDDTGEEKPIDFDTGRGGVGPGPQRAPCPSFERRRDRELAGWRHLRPRGADNYERKSSGRKQLIRSLGDEPWKPEGIGRDAWNAHHIVPLNAGEERGDVLRALMFRCRIHPNEERNGVYLRGTGLKTDTDAYQALRKRTKDETLHPAMLHLRLFHGDTKNRNADAYVRELRDEYFLYALGEYQPTRNLETCPDGGDVREDTLAALRIARDSMWVSVHVSGARYWQVPNPERPTPG